MTGRPTLEHTCAHPDCDRTLPSAIFACKPHWRTLPGDLKRAINLAWRDILSPGGIPRHEAVRSEAVEYWKLHRR